MYTFRAFFSEHLDIIKTRQVSVLARDVFNQYHKYCEERNIAEACKRSIGMYLKQLGVSTRTRKRGGEAHYIYKGLAWSANLQGLTYETIEDKSTPAEGFSWDSIGHVSLEELARFSSNQLLLYCLPDLPGYQKVQYVPKSMHSYLSSWVKMGPIPQWIYQQGLLPPPLPDQPGCGGVDQGLLPPPQPAFS